LILFIEIIPPRIVVSDCNLQLRRDRRPGTTELALAQATSLAQRISFRNGSDQPDPTTPFPPYIWWQVKKFQAPSQPALPKLFSFSSHPVSWPWRNSAPRISREEVNLCYSPRCLRPFERQKPFAAKRIRPPNFVLHIGGAWLPDPACSVIIRPSVRSCLGNVG